MTEVNAIINLIGYIWTKSGQYVVTTYKSARKRGQKRQNVYYISEPALKIKPANLSD